MFPHSFWGATFFPNSFWGTGASGPAPTPIIGAPTLLGQSQAPTLFGHSEAPNLDAFSGAIQLDGLVED